MRSPIAGCCLAILVFGLGNSAVPAQCTDADADGFFREAGCGTPEDCNDTAGDTFPGATEACDGYDNDCNGVLDDGPVCDRTCDAPEETGNEIVITQASDLARLPRLAWTGSEYGVAWMDRRDGNLEIYFGRLDVSGQRLDVDNRITSDPAISSDPVVSWTGQEFGLLWNDDRGGSWNVLFTRLDSSGNRLMADLPLTNHLFTQGPGDMVWTGSEYGLAWRDLRHGSFEIYFARLDRAGTMVGSEVRVTTSPFQSVWPSIAWTGSEFGIAWEDSRDGNLEIYFARLDAAGSKLGPDIRVTNDAGSSMRPFLAWNGSGYGVVWHDDRLGLNQVFFAELDTNGTKVGSEVRLTNLVDDAFFPVLAWSGEEFGVAWQEQRFDYPDIFFRRLGPSGQLIGSDVRLTDESTPHDDVRASIVWNGTDYGIGFERQMQPPSTQRIFLTRVGCNCIDGDGDGVSSCNDCDDLDSRVWAPPGEARDLVFTDKETISWTAPLNPGAVVSDLVYDTLRSEDPGDFETGTVCIESDDGTDTVATDSETPMTGPIFHYLVRPANACPAGEGELGIRSDGSERTGRSCP